MQVVAVDGEWGEAEDGVARAVSGEIDEHAERISRPAVMHVGHVGAQVRILRALNLENKQVLQMTTVYSAAV